MTSIDIEGLEFSYSKDALVLKGLDLSLSRPQLVSIIGPNGAGKSTLVHCIDRILTPTGGCVLVDDQPLGDYTLKDLARKVGYVSCASGGSFPMTVVDTVLMGRNPHRRWKTMHDDMVVVEEAMRMMDLGDHAMRYLDELSSGQRQRVMLARGIAQEPRILLLDEPTANLDIRHQIDVIRILKRLTVDKGMLVVIISHDINIASRYSDNIIMMSEGRIHAVGRPADVITEDNIRQVYDVESEVVDRDGHPFMMIRDPGPSLDDAGGVCTIDGRRGSEDDP